MKDSFVMTDKIVTVDKSMLGERIGILTEKDMKEVSEKLKMMAITDIVLAVVLISFTRKARKKEIYTSPS